MAEMLISDEFRTGIADASTVATMHVGHEVLAVFVESGLEGDGAACDVGVGLHQHMAVGEHRLRLVQMWQQVEVDVTRGLLHAQ